MFATIALQDSPSPLVHFSRYLASKLGTWPAKNTSVLNHQQMQHPKKESNEGKEWEKQNQTIIAQKMICFFFSLFLLYKCTPRNFSSWSTVMGIFSSLESIWKLGCLNALVESSAKWWVDSFVGFGTGSEQNVFVKKMKTPTSTWYDTLCPFQPCAPDVVSLRAFLEGTC